MSIINYVSDRWVGGRMPTGSKRLASKVKVTGESKIFPGVYSEGNERVEMTPHASL